MIPSPLNHITCYHVPEKRRSAAPCAGIAYFREVLPGQLLKNVLEGSTFMSEGKFGVLVQHKEDKLDWKKEFLPPSCAVGSKHCSSLKFSLLTKGESTQLLSRVHSASREMRFGPMPGNPVETQNPAHSAQVSSPIHS